MSNKFAAAIRLAMESDDSGLDTAPEVVDADNTVIDVSGSEAVAAGDAGQADTAAEVVVPAEPAAAPEAEEGPVVVDADDAVVIDGGETLEEAVSEMHEAAREVDDTAEQIETLEDSAAGLESIALLVNAAQQRGGLNAQAARAAKIAIESYAAPIGLTQSLMPSMESFGGDSSRLKSTQLTMENLKETIQKGWEALKKFLINLKTRVLAFLEKIFTAAGRLNARGQKLAAFKTAGTAKETQLELKGYGKRLAVGTKVETDAAKGLAELIATVKGAEILDGQLLEVGKYYQTLVGQLASGTIEPGNANVKEIKLAAPGFTEANGVLSSPVLPGNVQFKITKRAGNVLEKLFGASVKVDHIEASIPEDAKLPTLSVSAINKVGTELVALYGVVKDAQAASAKAVEAAKAIQIPTVKESISKDAQAAASALASVFRQNMAAHGQLSAKVCAHAISVALVYAKYAEASAAQYGKK